MELSLQPAYEGAVLEIGKTARVFISDEDMEQLERHCELALNGNRDFKLDADHDEETWEDWCRYYRELLGCQLYGADDDFTLEHGHLELDLNRGQVEDLRTQLKDAQTANWVMQHEVGDEMEDAALRGEG
jgi:hypothetical protein